MTKPPTVLISINSSWNIWHFRGALIQALKAQHYHIASAAPEDAYTEWLRTMVDAHYPLTIESEGTSPIKDFVLFLRYVRLLHRVKPAVMLTYTIKPNIYGSLAAQLLGIPHIANVSGLGTTFIRKNWLTEVVKFLYRIAFRKAACVFFQNSEDRDLFVSLKLVKPEKAALLKGSGIDLSYFTPQETSRMNNAPIRFVLIARLLWDKGIGEYIAAARIIKAAHPEVTFSLVGPLGVRNKTAIPEDRVTAWISEGIVEYLGERADVREIMAQHDCVVLPSYREGLSRVLLEAAAMGKPMIATDVPGCRQVVDHALNGFLCQLQDADDLAAMMLRFIALTPEQRTAMGRESRAKAEREFDERLVFDAYLAQIKSLLASS